MATDAEWRAAIEERLRQQDAVILGLKKEVGVLRHKLADAPENPKECRLGLGKDCSRASTYQYQQGCRGDACRDARAEYYNKQKKNGQPVEEPRRRLIRRGN